jgi:hypothetical protein
MSEMDKKDILEKAQKENKGADEMYNYLYRRGAQLAMTVGLVICCIGMIVDLIMNSTFTLLGCFMMIMQLSMQSTLYGFLAIKTKTKGNIVCFVLDSIALILFIVVLIIKLIGLA